MNKKSRCSHGDKAEDATFGTHAASGEPGRPVKSGIRKMAFKHIAAVWNGKQESLAEIECGVPADKKPQVAGAPEREREDQADGGNA